jgi:hypothetical protein
VAFRGYFALNDLELINSSRTVEHLGKVTPKYDYALGNTANFTCALTIDPGYSGLAELPVTSAELADFPGLATPPDGSYRYDPGLVEIGACWEPAPFGGCNKMLPWVTFDDTWWGLKDFLQDTVYRPELAPWYNVNIPQSGEFAGFWVMSMQGFGPTSVQRNVTENVGSGGSVGPARDSARQVSFSVLAIASTNAGLQYGIGWLTCALRETNYGTDAVLEFLTAHPGHSAADPSLLVRELHNVVLTQTPTVSNQYNASGVWHQQETLAVVSFALTALNPYSWFPADTVTVEWDTITSEAVTWIPASQCGLPSDCQPANQLVSAVCAPEALTVTTDFNPPVCGGGMPVTGFERYVFAVPTMTTPVWCPGTAVTMTVTNNSAEPLTVQGYWILAPVNETCSNRDRFQVQISGLPGYASVTLDGVTGTYCGALGAAALTPVGIIGTPGGSPWLPPFIDRTQPWQLEMLAPPGADFSVVLNLYDQDVA